MTVERSVHDEANEFGALDAVFGQRSRRFPLGGTLTGPLAFESERDPVPLSAEEEALLVAAATGVTGVVREEWSFLDAQGGPTGGDKLASFTGRSYPSPLANHSTEVFWTNDEGTFFLPARDSRPRAYLQNQTAGEREAAHHGAVKLSDGRLDIPRRLPNLFAFNHQNINVAGSTLFIPVADVTRQCIAALLLYFDRPHGYYLVDQRLGADPLRPFAESGLLNDAHPVDLADFERWQMVEASGVESGLVVANLGIAAAAVGLGGHPFSGGKGRVVLGGEAPWRAIGGQGLGSLCLGCLRPVPRHDRPVPYHRLVPGSSSGHRLLRPLLPSRGAAGKRPHPSGQVAPMSTQELSIDLIDNDRHGQASAGTASSTMARPSMPT